MSTKYIEYTDLLVFVSSGWIVHPSPVSEEEGKKIHELCFSLLATAESVSEAAKGRAAFNAILNMEITGAIQMPRSAQESCGSYRQAKEGQDGLNAPLRSDESWQLAKYLPKNPISEERRLKRAWERVPCPVTVKSVSMVTAPSDSKSFLYCWFKKKSSLKTFFLLIYLMLF